MKRLLFTLLIWAVTFPAHASVVQCQEKPGAEDKPEYYVKFVAARPLAILSSVAGAGNFVLYSEGDSDEILGSAELQITGEIKGASWLEVAQKVLERTNKTIRDAKILARVQAEILEYEETSGGLESITGPAPTATGAKRKLYRVTGTIQKPKAPKQRITFFNRKEEQ